MSARIVQSQNSISESLQLRLASAHCLSKCRQFCHQASSLGPRLTRMPPTCQRSGAVRAESPPSTPILVARTLPSSGWRHVFVQCRHLQQPQQRKPGLLSRMHLRARARVVGIHLTRWIGPTTRWSWHRIVALCSTNHQPATLAWNASIPCTIPRRRTRPRGRRSHRSWMIPCRGLSSEPSSWRRRHVIAGRRHDSRSRV